MAEAQAFRVTPLVKFALQIQVFLLRRNWMGSAGNFIMVITTKGRKSGKLFSTPITYIRDGDTLIAVNNGGISNWYKNALANPDVILEIKGKKYTARCISVTDPAEKQKIFDFFVREQAANFVRIFGIPVDSSPAALAKARDSRVYVRFQIITS